MDINIIPIPNIFLSIVKSEKGDKGKGWVSFSQTIPAGK